jgi:hypothetical protein
MNDLPPGFVLDNQPPRPTVATPPDGFVLDQPSPSPDQGGFWDIIKREAANAGIAADDVIRMIANGATFGQADKLAAYMGGDSLASEKARTKEAADRAGWAGTVAKIGAGIVPASAIAKGVGLGAGAVSSVPALGRAVANPFAQAGTVGATYGATDAALNDRDILKEGVIGAGAGVAGQAVANVLTGAVSKTAGLFNKKPDIPSAQMLRERANAAFQKADDAGVILKPDGVQRLATDIKQSFAEFGYHPQLQPKLAVALSELDNIARGNVTLKGMDILRRIASTAKTDVDPSTRKLAGEFVNKLDDFLDNVKLGEILTGDKSAALRALHEGRKLWGSVRKAEMIDGALAAAKMRTESTGSGGNIDNAIRQEFRKILNNSKKAKGLTADERTAMLEIVRGTSAGNLARLVGKLSPSGSGLMAALGIGATAANPVLAAAPIAGMIAKPIGDRATKVGADRLSEIVRAGGSRAATQPAPNAVQRLTEAERQRLARLLTVLGISSAVPSGP